MTIGQARYPDHQSVAEVNFGPFSLKRASRELYCAGRPIKLGAPSYRVLDVLVAHAGDTIDNLTLIRAAWGSLNVEESSLRAAVAALRRAMTKAGCHRSYITTVPRRGYRFSEAVTTNSVAQWRRPKPILPSSVVGRDGFISAVLDDLQQYRLVSVVGWGGIGKTTVAQRVVEQALERGYADDAGFVALDTGESPENLLQAMTRDLGVPAMGEDGWRDIEAFLDSRRTLVILDGCEQVIEAAAPVVETLLSLHTNIRLLCTSREPLRAAGERIRRLEGLPVPSDNEDITPTRALRFASVELFADRAKESVPEFQMTDTSAPFVASICKHLDGCPLAIEIAAAQMDAFDLPTLAQLVSGTFSLQMLGRTSAAPRHRTLGACLDWSFDSLSHLERLAFQRLSVFGGAFSFELARQVIGFGEIRPIEVSDLVARLASKSLVVGGTGEAQGRRRLPRAARIYAGVKLDETGERPELARRHAEYYKTVLATGQSRTDAVASREWAERYAGDVEQIWEAITWAGSPSGDPELHMILTEGARFLLNHLRVREVSSQ